MALTKVSHSMISGSFVSPLDYGAVGNGSTNDLAAFKLACESGKAVDGGGLTYAISGTCQPTSFVGLQNANFIQLAPTTASVATLAIVDINDFFIDNCSFNMGSTVDTGSSDDSSKNALRITHSVDGSYVTNFKITRVSVTGDGSGSRIQIRQAKRFLVDNCSVQNCQAGSSPDPTNDIMNGIDIGDAANYTLSNSFVYNLQSRVGGVFSTNFTRGILITESRDCVIIGCTVTAVDQAYDFSGGVGGTAPAAYEGNRRWTISGCTSNNANTWGFKFANVARDGLVTGCIANNTGSGGFVVSPAGSAATAEKYVTQNIDFVGCKAVNVLGNGAAGINAIGFMIVAGVYYTTFPRAIRFISCNVIDTQDTPTTVDGFKSEGNVVVYPNTGYDLAIANQVIGCSASANITNYLSGNLGSNYCQVTSQTALTQSIPNNTQTVLTWDYNLSDRTGLHSTSSNTSNIYIKTPGFYRIEALIEFNNSATGQRQINLRKNGVVIDRTRSIGIPSGSINSTLYSLTVEYLESGDFVSVFGFQDSGGALNVQSDQSHLLVARVDG